MYELKMHLKLYHLKLNRTEKLPSRESEALIYNISMVFIKISIFRLVPKSNASINIFLFLLTKKSYNTPMYLTMCHILTEHNTEVYRPDAPISLWVSVSSLSSPWAGVTGPQFTGISNFMEKAGTGGGIWGETSGSKGGVDTELVVVNKSSTLGGGSACKISKSLQTNPCCYQFIYPYQAILIRIIKSRSQML